MTRSQRKALRFAYRLLRGDFASRYLPYTSGHWIEPDHASDRPYLNEEILTALVVRGFMECDSFFRSETVYLYRITRLHRLPQPPRWHPPALSFRGGKPVYQGNMKPWFLSRRKRA